MSKRIPPAFFGDAARYLLEASFRANKGVVITVAMQCGEGPAAGYIAFETDSLVEMPPDSNLLHVLGLAHALRLTYEKTMSELANRAGMSPSDFENELRAVAKKGHKPPPPKGERP